MRILVVTVVHVPLDARIHNRQVRSLVSAGHDVVLAAPFADYGISPDVVDVRTVDLPRASGRGRAGSLRAAWGLMRRVAPSADLVLLHDPELLLVVPARLATPVVWDVHEDLASSLEDKPWLPRMAQAPVRAAVQALEGRAERRHHLLLAEPAYAQRFGRTHPVVPNLPWLPPPPSGPVSDRVVHLGRHSRLRGVHDLIQVGARLRDHGLLLELIGQVDADVAGDVAAAEERGDVVAHGFVPNDRAVQMLDGALAGLSLLHDHPNYRHSLPTKVAEYQAAGVPVVTTPLPTATAMVRGAASGLVVDFQDPEAAAEAVLALHADRLRARRLGDAGRADAERGNSWDAVGPGFVATLETIARR